MNDIDEFVSEVTIRLSIDAKNERIAELQQQLTVANFAASQVAQMANLMQRLNATSIPAYQVASPYTSLA